MLAALLTLSACATEPPPLTIVNQDGDDVVSPEPIESSTELLERLLQSMPRDLTEVPDPAWLALGFAYLELRSAGEIPTLAGWVDEYARKFQGGDRPSRREIAPTIAREAWGLFSAEITDGDIESLIPLPLVDIDDDFSVRLPHPSCRAEIIDIAALVGRELTSDEVQLALDISLEVAYALLLDALPGWAEDALSTIGSAVYVANLLLEIALDEVFGECPAQAVQAEVEALAGRTIEIHTERGAALAEIDPALWTGVISMLGLDPLSLGASQESTASSSEQASGELHIEEAAALVDAILIFVDSSLGPIDADYVDDFCAEHQGTPPCVGGDSCPIINSCDVLDAV